MMSQTGPKTHLVTDMRPIMPSDLSIATSCIGDAFMSSCRVLECLQTSPRSRRKKRKKGRTTGTHIRLKCLKLRARTNVA